MAKEMKYPMDYMNIKGNTMMSHYLVHFQYIAGGAFKNQSLDIEADSPKQAAEIAYNLASSPTAVLVYSIRTNSYYVFQTKSKTTIEILEA
jgi:hypothetical protein